MKKTLTILTILILMVMGFSLNKTEAKDKISVMIDGKNVSFPDGQPFVNTEKRTMIPIRFVSEELGYKVTWKPSTKEVSIQNDEKKVSLKMNSKIIYVNGKTQLMDTKAEVIGGRTYVPLRFIAQGFENDVTWDNNIKKVLIVTPKGPAITIGDTENIIYNNTRSFIIAGKTESKATVYITASDKNEKKVSKQSIADDSGNYKASLDISSLENGVLTLAVQAKGINKKLGEKREKNISKDSTYYVLDESERKRWSIYNDGNFPVETTKGINDALIWANSARIRTFYVPSGTYMIKKDKQINSYTRDTTARINMVSDITFLLDEKATIQKETNNLEGYFTLYVGAGVENVTIKGGTYKGDRTTHDYSNGATHEGGEGIITAGGRNITIDGVKTIDFTGDGLCICGSGNQISVLSSADFESGSIDDNGNLISDPTKIRTKIDSRTSLTNPVFQKDRTIHFSLATNLPKDGPFDLYFYKTDGTFISSEKNLETDWSLIDAPMEADYFKLVYHASNLSNIQLQYWNKPISRDVVVKNSETAFNRRQGITVGGVDGLLIENNKIHDISGTAPESGIDIEGGAGGNGHPNMNILIKNNHFYNNDAYNVILYDGENVTVDGNLLEGKGTVYNNGVTISAPFRKGALIKNNTFDTSNIIGGDDAVFLNNTIKNALATFYGPNMVDGLTLENASIAMRSTTPYGVEMNNITFNNTDTARGYYSLAIYNNPIHFKNVTINGSMGLAALYHQNVNGNIFDNLKLYNHRGITLPGGTYNNCVIESDAFATGSMNSSGVYTFDGCTFKGYGPLKIENDVADVTIKNSTFNTFGNKEMLAVEKAKNVEILNNIFNGNTLPYHYQSLIRIGYFFDKDISYKVESATIKGNVVNASSALTGISTEYAGVGAPGYTIEENILYNAKLKLKANDTINNNQELTK